MNDMKITWLQIVKSDLIVLNGRWWKVKAIEFFDYHGDALENSGDFPARCEVKMSSFEGNDITCFPNDVCESVRVRPAGPDPWEGRRKEGRE